ncbi:MAG TPA: hypothetical protein VJ179_03480 [Patescibacteria group bacterium]|nr:hypothetical protein [Patescibacteria group bacterium]
MRSSGSLLGILHADTVGIHFIAVGNAYVSPEQPNRFQPKKELKFNSIKTLHPRAGEAFATEHGQRFVMRHVGKKDKKGTYEIEFHGGKKVICTKKLKARRLPRLPKRRWY